MTKVRLCTALSYAALLFAATAMAGGGVTGGATEFTQLLNNGELAAQVRQQLRTYQALADELQILRGNERMLTGHHFADAPSKALIRLHRAMQNDHIISYQAGSIHDEFALKYPSYTDLCGRGIRYRKRRQRRLCGVGHTKSGKPGSRAEHGQPESGPGPGRRPDARPDRPPGQDHDQPQGADATR